jgi:hypothetical protein
MKIICVEHKARMKIDQGNKILNFLELLFSHIDFDFLWNIFCHEFVIAPS